MSTYGWADGARSEADVFWEGLGIGFRVKGFRFRVWGLERRVYLEITPTCAGTPILKSCMYVHIYIYVYLYIYICIHAIYVYRHVYIYIYMD